MNLSEIRELVHVGRPDAPYGVRALARCYSIGDLRRLARRRLPAGALGYLEGGGEDEWTLRRNREAFGEVELVPRVLRDVSQPDTGTTVLGTPMPLPLILSPVGSPGMFHHDGELAVARAARHAGLTYGVSTLATQPLEAIADAAQGTPLWFQLYLWGDRSAARKLVAQARAAGIPGPAADRRYRGALQAGTGAEARPRAAQPGTRAAARCSTRPATPPGPGTS